MSFCFLEVPDSAAFTDGLRERLPRRVLSEGSCWRALGETSWRLWLRRDEDRLLGLGEAAIALYDKLLAFYFAEFELVIEFIES